MGGERRAAGVLILRRFFFGGGGERAFREKPIAECNSVSFSFLRDACFRTLSAFF